MRATAYEKLLPPLVAKVRQEVYDWRTENYAGASPTSQLSFTHISLLTEVLTVINIAAIFHNTIHLFELSNELNENTITV